MSGTGGGMSLRCGAGAGSVVYSTASGLQKEDMVGRDMFQLDMERGVFASPDGHRRHRGVSVGWGWVAVGGPLSLSFLLTFISYFIHFSSFILIIISLIFTFTFLFSALGFNLDFFICTLATMVRSAFSPSHLLRIYPLPARITCSFSPALGARQTYSFRS